MLEKKKDLKYLFELINWLNPPIYSGTWFSSHNTKQQ